MLSRKRTICLRQLVYFEGLDVVLDRDPSSFPEPLKARIPTPCWAKRRSLALGDPRLGDDRGCSGWLVFVIRSRKVPWVLEIPIVLGHLRIRIPRRAPPGPVLLQSRLGAGFGEPEVISSMLRSVLAETGDEARPSPRGIVTTPDRPAPGSPPPTGMSAVRRSARLWRSPGKRTLNPPATMLQKSRYPHFPRAPEAPTRAMERG